MPRAAAEDESKFRLRSPRSLRLWRFRPMHAMPMLQHPGARRYRLYLDYDASAPRRALVTVGLFGGDARPSTFSSAPRLALARAISLDLPAQAEELRARIRSDAAEGRCSGKGCSDKLDRDGYVMPHWPRP